MKLFHRSAICLPNQSINNNHKKTDLSNLLKIDFPFECGEKYKRREEMRQRIENQFQIE